MREIKILQVLFEGNARQGKIAGLAVSAESHSGISIFWKFCNSCNEKWSQMSVKLFEVFLDIINLPCSSSSNFFMYPEKLGSGTFWFEWKCRFSIQRKLLLSNAKHSQTCCISACWHVRICRYAELDLILTS